MNETQYKNVEVTNTLKAYLMRNPRVECAVIFCGLNYFSCECMLLGGFRLTELSEHKMLACLSFVMKSLKQHVVMACK